MKRNTRNPARSGARSRQRRALVLAAAPLGALALFVDPPEEEPATVGVAGPQEERAAPADSEQEAADAEQRRRGEYLVLHVANCVSCHSPRGSDGEIVAERLLSGARNPFAAPEGFDRWALRAPDLRGLAGHEAEEALAILTGEAEPEELPRPPMPSFRMHAEDAQAVIAYLGSLE